MAPKYPEPNRLDPLSEPTLNRRLWGAYLRVGFRRAEFARALDVRDNLIRNWDLGLNTISLPNLIRAALIVGYSIDELVHGAKGRPHEPESALDHAAIGGVLDDIAATPAQHAALVEHEDSIEGRYQRLTRTYVVRFVTAYQDGIALGKPHDVAMRNAIVQAHNARALVDASDSGRKPFALLPTAPPARERVYRKRVKIPTTRAH
jgi:hypothetical protein